MAPEDRALLKRRLSRFQIMQRYRFQLKLTQAVEPEWGTLGRLQLDYSPVAFFSGDVGRRARAIRSLLRNPQNFLQLSLDGRTLYGRGLEDPAAAEQAVTELQLSPPHEGGGPFDALADLLARVLAQEPLLERLWALQAMDVLDVEGAGLVLQRLTALCGGAEAKALARLATAELEPLAAVVPEEPRLVELEGTLARAVARGGRGKEDDDEPEEADCVWQAQQHQQARAAVAALSDDNCVWLLRRWLVSLGACDASLMVSLRRCRGNAVEPHLQTAAETAGVLRLDANGQQDDEEGGACAVAYCVHVVDLGPKDPRKIISKAQLEPDLLALAAASAGVLTNVNVKQKR